VYLSAPAEALAYEIVSVDSATSLTVSVLRATTDGAAVAPPAGSNLKYYINTFAPQIAAVQATLYDKLRQISQACGISGGDFADSPQLRSAAALGVLAAVFTARASNATGADANWTKAELYRRQHVAALSAVRLARDLDGDGFAERTRSLSNVTLRRD
jgi:NAD-dependent oxidoreductase involved in siderophore biosynthesis